MRNEPADLNAEKQDNRHDNVSFIDLSLAADGSSQPLTAEDQLRLRAVFDLMRSGDHFRRDPTVSDLQPIEIRYQNANRKRVVEQVKLSHRILMRPSRRHGQRFQIGAKGVKPIGEGSFGVVRHARRYLRELNNGVVDIKTVEQVVKIVRLRREASMSDANWQAKMRIVQQSLDSEIKVMSDEHPHVKEMVKREYSLQGDDGQQHEFVTFHLYMPNLGPELLTQLMDLDVEIDISLARTCAISEQILSALASLHLKGRVHKDIKPDNILGDIMVQLDDMKISLIDFGLTEPITTVSPVVSGTPEYVAKEILDGQMQYTSDVYSAGMIIALLFGLLPEELEIKAAALKNGQWVNIDLTQVPHLGVNDALLRTFLARMLAPIAYDRPSAVTCRDFFRYIRPTMFVVDNPAALLKSLVENSQYWLSEEITDHDKQALDDLFDLLQNPARIPTLIALRAAVGEQYHQHITAVASAQLTSDGTPFSSKVNAVFQRHHGSEKNLAFVTSKTIEQHVFLRKLLMTNVQALKDFIGEQSSQATPGLFSSADSNKKIAKAKLFIEIFTNLRMPLATRSLFLYCLSERAENRALLNAFNVYNADENKLVLDWVKNLAGISEAQTEGLDKLIDDITNHIEAKLKNPQAPEADFNLQQRIEALTLPAATEQKAHEPGVGGPK